MIRDQTGEPLHADMTAFLLARGASPVHLASDGTTSLHDAEASGHTGSLPRSSVPGPPTSARESYYAGVTDDLSLAPFRIHTFEDGSQQLWLFDGDMEEVAEVFEDRHVESNGHGWEAFASWLLEAEMPDTTELIWFGSEGGTFVAGSSDPAALRRLAERLHAAFHDRSLLARLVTEADLD